MKAGTIRGETAKTITRTLGVPGQPSGWSHKVTLDCEEDRLGINVSTRDAFARLTIYTKATLVSLSVVDKENGTHTFKCYDGDAQLLYYDQDWDAKTGKVGPKRPFNVAKTDLEALRLVTIADKTLGLINPHLKPRL